MSWEGLMPGLNKCCWLPGQQQRPCICPRCEGDWAPASMACMGRSNSHPSTQHAPAVLTDHHCLPRLEKIQPCSYSMPLPPLMDVLPGAALLLLPGLLPQAQRAVPRPADIQLLVRQVAYAADCICVAFIFHQGLWAAQVIHANDSVQHGCQQQLVCAVHKDSLYGAPCNGEVRV